MGGSEGYRIEQNFVFVQLAHRPDDRKSVAFAALRGNTSSATQNKAAATVPKNTTYCGFTWKKKVKSFIMAQ